MAATVARVLPATWASSRTLFQEPGQRPSRSNPCKIGSSFAHPRNVHARLRTPFTGKQVKLGLRVPSRPSGQSGPTASLGGFFNRSNEERAEPSAPPYYEDEDMRQTVMIRMRRNAGEFRRWGNWGFWVQLITAVVSAVILAFSVAITGQATNAVSAYLTAGGIVAAFVSVFNFFRYTRLAREFEEASEDPEKAPARNKVNKKLTNGVILNMVGLAATLLGAQATVGLLVAKALTSQSQPYLANTPQGFSPVLALDVFLVQASFNVVTAHFFGLLFQLLLLRSSTTSAPPPESVIPKPA